MIKSRSEFQYMLPQVYAWLVNNKKLNLLDVLGPRLHKQNGYWTYEKCLNEFKKHMEFKLWRIHSPSSYVIAKNNGWVLRIRKKFKIQGRRKWTKAECIKIAIRYKTKIEWKTKHNRTYEFSHNKGWFQELSKHMSTTQGIWTKQSCLASARKFHRVKDWQKAFPGALSKAQKKGWYRECVHHMKIYIINLNTEEIFDSSKKASTRHSLSTTCITKACKHGTVSGGYRWAYCDEKGEVLK